MRVFTPRRLSPFFIWSLMLTSLPVLLGQTSNTSPVVLDGRLQRHVVTAQSANTTLTFENLIVGETYSLNVPEDPALLNCLPEVAAENGDIKILSYDPSARQLKFTASATTMSFRLKYPCTWDETNPPRHYVSIVCETCVKTKFSDFLKSMAVLEVTPGGSAEDLVREVLIGGNCFDITNVTYTGQASQIGTFTQGQTNIGFSDGMIMASGSCDVAVGPNDQDNASAGFGIAASDADLTQMSGSSNLYDLANIEFDFTPTQTPLVFEYVFGSEEYCEYVGSQFNDAFGFFISGPGINGPFSGNSANIASIGPGNYVTINNVNHISNAGLYVNNQPSTSGNLCGQNPANGPAVNEVQFDGFTRKLTAVANVIPCSTYHIKLKICDVGDGIFDSGVFLRAGSFDAGGNASVEWLVNGQPDVNEVYEGCGTVQLLFDRVGGNMNSPLLVQYTITGTATSGQDFSPIPLVTIIPAGQDKVYINVNIINDLIAEGAETIVIKLNSPCSCIEPTETLTILDLLPLTAIPDTTVICGPGTGTVGVTPVNGGAPYTYLWSTGSTEQTITQFVGTSTNFKVTVSDNCGKTFVTTARIVVKPLPKASLLPPAPQICPGQSALLQVTFTGDAPFELVYTQNGVPQSPITDITQNPYFIEINEPGLYQIQSVTDKDGCVGTGQGALLVLESTLSLSGVVANPTCYGLSNGSINTTVSGGQGPFNYVWEGPQNVPNIADPLGLQGGIYNVTVTDGYGCTNAQQFNVVAPTEITPTLVNVVGANCTYPTGGSINLDVTGGTPNYTYNWTGGFTGQDPQNLGPGNYTVTVTDSKGCSKTTTATVPGDFTPPDAVANAPDPITCIVTSVSLDGAGSSVGPNFTYNWTASAGGNIVSGGNTLNPIVNKGGTYTLVVTNTTNGCTASQSVQVTPDNTLPTANAGPNQTLTCTLLNATLNGNGSSTGPNFTYHWTASNGGTITSGDSTLNPVVSTTGTYTLLVTNTSNGCTKVDDAIVNSNTTPPVAIIGNPAILTCTNSTVTLNGSNSTPSGSLTYSWTTTNGNIQSGQNSANAVVIDPGQYTLVVTNTVNGCTHSATTTVIQDSSIPVASAAVNDVLDCNTTQLTINGAGSSSGANYTIVWSFTAGGNIVSGQNTLNPVVDKPATYTLLITNNTNQCTATASVVVTQDIQAPAANAGLPSTLTCAITSLILGDSSALIAPNLNYVWTTIGGNIQNGGNTPTPLINKPGTYNLVVTNTTNGCSTTASVVIPQDITKPTAVVAPPNELNCVTSVVQLNASGSSTGSNFSYAWNSSVPGAITSGANTLTPTVNAVGIYTLTITNSANGCSSVASANVNSNTTPPVAVATPSGLLTCAASQVTVSANGSSSGPNFTYQWQTTNGQIVNGQNTATLTVDAPGQYTLVVTNNINGCTQSQDATVGTDYVAPAANAGSPFQLTCVQNTYTLNATASTGPQFTYNWTTNTGNFTTPTDILNPTVNGAGDYILLVTNTINGCTASASVNITQASDVPVAVANNAPQLTCAVTTLNLSGAGSSTGPEFAYLWTTSTGNILLGANTLNPTINAPGTYILAVTNIVNNCTSSSSVVVDEDVTPPTIDAGQPQTLTCVILSLNLSGTVSSNGNFTYNWTASNGGNITLGANTLTPTVNATGLYNLLVTNTLNGCTSTDNVQVIANQVNPVAAIASPSTLTCDVQQITLNATASSTGSNFSYLWTTAGGYIVNQSNPLQPVVNQPGNYTLLVTNNINGCTQTAFATVPQDIVNPVANAGADGLLTCAVTSLQLNGTGSSQNGNYSYQWTTTTGQILGGASTLNPMIGAGGTYTLVVENQNNGCTSSDNVVVNVDVQPPVVAIAAPNVITCIQPQVTLNGSGSQSGPNISYTWTTLGGSIVSGQNSNQATVNAAGNYILTVLNNTNGCSSFKEVQVSDNVVLPAAEAGQPFTLTCSVEQVTLQGSGSTGALYSYAWSTQGGQIISGANTPNPVVNQQGMYTLTVLNTATGCTKTDEVEVFREMNMPTDFAFNLKYPTCKDNDGAITFGQVAGGVGPYLFSINNGQTFSPKIDFAKIAPGTYDLMIQDANGCEFHKSLTVPKAPDPAIKLPPDFEIDFGDSSEIQATLPPGYPLALIDTVIWTPLTGLTFNGNTIADLLNPMAKPFKPIEYKVTVISGDGCEATDRVIIRVDNEPHIYIPNAFSPWNEDGENDKVYIFADGDQVVQINSFQIFDRWGAMVFQKTDFQPNDPAYGWDGRHLGKLLTPAVFSYYAEILLIDGRVVLYKGDVTIVR